MRLMRRKVWRICLALAFVLEACQPVTPVKIPQAITPLRPATAAPEPLSTRTALPAGFPTPPEPTAASFHAADPLTWVEAISAEPKTLDPALEYETNGANILSHLYDPLITYRKDQLDALVPALAEEVPSYENGGISADGRAYTFKIRAEVRFHDGSRLTAGDVAYSLQRGLLQGGTFSPQWLLAEALFGAGVYDVAALLDPLQPPYDDRDRLSSFPASQLEGICQSLKEAIQANELERTVTFHLKQPWSPFLAALPGSWGSITSQAWVKDHGGWGGDCGDWQNYYAPSADETIKNVLGRGAIGTGPFRLDHWAKGAELVLVANADYWRKQPAWEGGPVGAPRLQKVIIKFVPEFSSRLNMLQSGQADAVEVPRGEEPLLDALVGEICDAAGGACTLTGSSGSFLRRYEQIPSTNRLDAFFTFNLNPENNPYIGSGRLDGEGIPANFFSDAHVRRAFVSCFDGDKYRQSVLNGQGTRAQGLIPNSFPGAPAGGDAVEFDPEKCAAEFKASTLKSQDGKSLWDTGFRVAIAYPIGNTADQTIAQIWQQVLGQVNPKFVVAVTGIPWQAYVNGLIASQLPVFYGRWVADIADPHNWVAPYIDGCFAVRQSMPADLQQPYQQLAAAAAEEPDPKQRAALYADLNRQFGESSIALLLYQAPESMYLPRYARGYYPNPLLPGTVNWYAMSKE